MRTSLVVLIASGLLSGCLSSGGDGSPSAIRSNSVSSTSAVAGTQLGVAGESGVSEELVGADLLTPLIGGEGLVGATLGGGEGGVLAGNLPAESPVPEDATAPLTSGLAQIQSQVPHLGVSGEGGLSEDLLGHDITGMLVGTEGGAVPVLLSGGSEAQLGDIVPEGATPLSPVGDLVAGLIDGAQADSSNGNLNALAPVLSPVVLGLLGAGGEGEGPVPGVAVPSLPIEQLAPVVVPAANAATQVLATPLLPNGTTATDVVFPVVLGAGAGIADAALPLETVNDTIITVLP
ncbi:hypothetical protein [Parvibaculum sp.]|uniref:hypothetical protein n=1 Tax=Parvibaculum sp. TaxID=2024848 RepID=UPI001B10616C|nr:hypothetical protein [Parvibaculum sp.]MBO6633551.1 hypothetical protein [Parvibaculum sp.]MBO6677689.1 hypothetical protein [Parvibaculum sp.]MBO6685377.1 hypothetical protein [Parvibaculum sp.]MBO6904205.1 hypothetical protein [Parvibaculum sp.]